MSDTDHEQGADPDRLAMAAASSTGKPHRWSRSRGGAVFVLAAFVGAVMLVDLLRPYLLSDPVLQLHPSPAGLPTVRFQDERGQDVTLSDFSGRVVLLNVWATWCPPCRDEMPALDALQRALGDTEFEVVAIATDTTGVASVRRFYERLGIRSLAVYVDSNSTVATRLRVAGLPTTLLVDREGREIGRTTGPADWDGEGARSLLLRYVQSRSPSPQAAREAEASPTSPCCTATVKPRGQKRA